MQKLMSKKFGLTATDTLAILQKLYDAKLISYPRTDCRFLREDMKDKLYASLVDVHAHLRAMRPTLHLSQQDLMPKKIAVAARAFDDKQVEGHYGLVPTGETNGISTLTGNDLFAFLTVVQTTLMALDEAAKYRGVTRRYTQEGGTGPYAPAVFRASREQIEFPGFNRWVKREERPARDLPPITETQVLDAATLKELTTKPPEHFTDATLLDAMKYAGETFDENTPEEQREAMIEVMKDKGIGTAATRANIIEKILLRGFVVRENPASFPPKMAACSAASSPRAPEPPLRQTHRRMGTHPQENGAQHHAHDAPEFLDALLASVVSMKAAFISGSTRAGLDDPVVPVTAGTPVEGAICPKSNEALLDRGPFFEASGFPGLRLWKSAFGRPCGRRRVRRAPHEPPRRQTVPRRESEIRDWQPHLRGRPRSRRRAQETRHPRPRAHEGERHQMPEVRQAPPRRRDVLRSPGWPGVKLWKTAFGKTFTAADYVPILQGWKDNAPIDVTGLVSAKSGKPYTAKIVLDTPSSKMKLDFGAAESSPATPAAPPLHHRPRQPEDQPPFRFERSRQRPLHRLRKTPREWQPEAGVMPASAARRFLPPEPLKEPRHVLRRQRPGRIAHGNFSSARVQLQRHRDRAACRRIVDRIVEKIAED